MARQEMSTLAQFDDLCRGFNFWMNDSLNEFEHFARSQEECRQKWLSTEERCSCVLRELNEARVNKEKLELQVCHVTELLKNEIRIRQRIQKEERDLERKLNMVKQIVSSDRNIGADTREMLVSISSIDSFYRGELESPGDHLIDTTSDEVESSTRSILSSLDITTEKTDDDLELSIVRSARKLKAKFNRSPQRTSRGHNDLPSAPSHCASKATQKLCSLGGRTASPPAILHLNRAEQRGAPEVHHFDAFNSIAYQPGFKSREPVSARIEVRRSSSNRVVRQHNLTSKVILKQEICTPCNTRIRFGRSAMRCVDCFVTCHTECKTNLPTPCVPTVRTPTRFVGTIADYSPKTSPMVPALLVHCLEEIELRGLDESGLYRIAVPDKEIHSLKESLLSGKLRSGQMTGINIHAIAGVVRSFLLSLKEPLVTYTSRESFIKLGYLQDETDVQTAVCSLVPELPQPNRDTLAYLILHLQRLAENQSHRMSTSTLAKVFAPMIIGSSRPPVEDGLKKLQELKEQQKAVEKLLSISSDYWCCYGRYTESSTVTPVQSSKKSCKRTGFFTSPHFNSGH